jgi:hypothetical protein
METGTSTISVGTARLILGHHHPVVTAAVHAAYDRGTHFGACHEAEIRLGRIDHGNGPVGGTRALHELRDRGDADGPATGASLHRAAERSCISEDISMAGTITCRAGTPTISTARRRLVSSCRHRRQRADGGSERCRGDRSLVLRSQGYCRRDPGADRRQFRQDADRHILFAASARADQTGRNHFDF